MLHKICDMAADDPFYAPNQKVGIPRTRTPGLEVWCLHNGERMQTCELKDHSRVDAGWDVLMLEDDELRFSIHCEDERDARYAANSLRQDLVRTGWTHGR